MKGLPSNELDNFKKEKFNEFKSFYETKNNSELQNIDNNHKLASYKVAYLIAKHLKYFTDGEFAKKCMVTVAKTLFPNNFEIIDQFEKVSLNRNSISDKIVNISNSLENDLKISCSKLKFFSICLDETNDKTDVKHLAFFIRGVFNDFEYFENFLDLVKLPKNSTGEALYDQLKIVFQKFNLNYEAFISITSDGAKNLLGDKKGLIARIKNFMFEYKMKNELINFHCLLHQENLCCKKLELDSVFEKVFDTVKILKKPGNCHKEFKNFLDDENADFSDVIYFTEVRWLSRANCLKRFFDLIENIDKFFIEKNEQIFEFSNPLWVFKLAFVVDVTTLLNQLNISIQGKNKFILYSFEQIKNFKIKLASLIEETEQTDFFQFLNAEEIFNKFNLDKNSNFNIKRFSDFLKNLQSRFQARFSDFENQFTFDLFLKPFMIKRNKLPNQFQIEVREMRKLNFEVEFEKCLSNKEKLNFFKHLPDQFFHFKNNALKILSMFSSSY